MFPQSNHLFGFHIIYGNVKIVDEPVIVSWRPIARQRVAYGIVAMTGYTAAVSSRRCQYCDNEGMFSPTHIESVVSTLPT